MPVVIDIGSVGDGEDRASLGSDGRLVGVVGVADAARVRRPAQRARLQVERRQVGALDARRGRHQGPGSPAERLHSISEVLLSPVAVAFD